MDCSSIKEVQETENKLQLNYLMNHFKKNQIQIEEWFSKQWSTLSPSIYCSVDLRNAGYKLAPVDTNLFPGGFNNLSEDLLLHCVAAMQSTLNMAYPECRNILLIPENHTRNLYYLENVATLHAILLNAGYEVRVGSLIPDLEKPCHFDLPSGRRLYVEPVIRRGTTLELENFSPSLIFLNNDLSAEIPPILQQVQQPIDPMPQLGWHARLKSNHFTYYQFVAECFASEIAIDPWLIAPYTESCHHIDFSNGNGHQQLAETVDAVFNSIKQKYAEYKINQRPFVVIKADNGTYGMSVMMIHDAAEIFKLNRKNRTRMSTSKGGTLVDKVLIQEGVYTIEQSNQKSATAEPVIYMIGQHTVGGFNRLHPTRSDYENLNSPGMYFEPLTAQHLLKVPTSSFAYSNWDEKYYLYSVVARLAMLASAHEKKEVPIVPDFFN